jgi:hypothetical protein
MPIRVRVAESKFHFFLKKKWRPWREPEIGRCRKLRARSAVEMGRKGGDFYRKWAAGNGGSSVDFCVQLPQDIICPSDREE